MTASSHGGGGGRRRSEDWSGARCKRQRFAMRMLAAAIFATGFGAREHDRARVWGRPAGLAVAADGSLLVADDTGGAIWRISYAP